MMPRRGRTCRLPFKGRKGCCCLDTGRPLFCVFNGNRLDYPHLLCYVLNNPTYAEPGDQTTTIDNGPSQPLIPPTFDANTTSISSLDALSTPPPSSTTSAPHLLTNLEQPIHTHDLSRQFHLPPLRWMHFGRFCPNLEFRSVRYPVFPSAKNLVPFYIRRPRGKESDVGRHA